MTTPTKFAIVALVLAATAGGAAAQSLDAWAARHFNAGESVADRQDGPGQHQPGSATTLMARGSAGATLGEQAAIHFNDGVAVQDRMTTAAARSSSNAEAIEASAATLFNSGVSVQDRQTY